LQPGAPIHEVVERNIEALLDRAQEERRTRSLRDRMVDAITHFTGSLTFVYVHVVIVAAWVAVNAGWTPLPRFDQTFVLLATIASVEAIFLTSFVLITQNRMQVDADRRADLHLQIGLLAEHELTQLIKLVGEIAERLDVRTSPDPELAKLQRDVKPEHVLDTMEEKKRSRS
jgi:uncharacterized membrane protein